MSLHSARSTPTRQRPKRLSVEEFPQEFGKRALLLTASFYDNPQSTDLSFPPLTIDRSAPAPPAGPKPVEFNSPVADLRLRRRLESQVSEFDSRQNSISDEVRAVNESAHDSPVDLSAVFGDTFVRTPVRAQLDEPDDHVFRRTKRHRIPLNMQKIKEESIRRLNEAERRGTSDAKRRKLALEQQAPSEPSYRTSIGRDEKSPVQVFSEKGQDASNRRDGQVCHRRRDDYSEPAKPKKPSTPK
jgi:hypothetical protein